MHTFEHLCTAAAEAEQRSSRKYRIRGGSSGSLNSNLLCYSKYKKTFTTDCWFYYYFFTHRERAQLLVLNP